MCWAPILRRMYPRAIPKAEHHTATMDRTANKDLSLANNSRIQNAGYVIKHKMVRIAIRVKLGVSKPRNSGFDRGVSNLRSVSLTRRDCRLENRDLSEISTDGDGEGQAGYSGSNSLLFGVRGDGSPWMSGVAGFSVVSGLGLSSLVRICSMLRAWGGVRDHPMFIPNTYSIIAASCTLFAAQDGFGLSPYIAFRPSPNIHRIAITACQAANARSHVKIPPLLCLGRLPWNPIRGKDQAPQSAWLVCRNMK